MYMVAFDLSRTRLVKFTSWAFALLGDSVQRHGQQGQILSAVTDRHVTVKSVRWHTPFQSVPTKQTGTSVVAVPFHLESSPK